jgi:hypothetical protein
LREARCPECGAWSPVVWILEVHGVGGFWWADSGGCPQCGALICVESECEFREVA